MPSQRIVVRGRVQGVGFRAYVQGLAQELGLVGEVWNRRDGAVELTAQHEDPAVLAQFAHRIERHGPGYVQQVWVTEDARTLAKSFEIGPSR